MKATQFLLTLLLGLSFGALQAQEGNSLDKYWVFFSDKGSLEQYEASDFLSPKAIERRARQGIAIDEKDFPVHRNYLDAVQGLGAELRHPSKWLNATSAWMDSETASQVAALPFVRKVQPIKTARLDYEPVEPMRIGYEPGHSSRQLDMIGLNVLHQNGFNGTGVVVAVMDNGFVDANDNLFLEHLFIDDRIVATYDFVNDEENVYNQGSHGTWVLSILAAWHEDFYDSLSFYGSAHGASFILCHTEDDASETTREEDNWVAAAEFADSAGADILSTSLGYLGMDDLAGAYTWGDMDGNSTIITRGADLAASRGLIVVNSAGNSGSTGASTITAPADGDSVFAIGAVNETKGIASFSSRGPTADNRLKPDVCAMGFLTGFISTGGGLSRGNGTSFSCPLVSGMLACILQAQPETSNMEMYEAMIRSADRYDSPNNTYGYGIPYGPTMLTNLGFTGNMAFPADGTLDENGGFVFPNPIENGRLSVVYDNEQLTFQGSVDVFDDMGKRVIHVPVQIAPFYNVFRLDEEIQKLNPGLYIVRLQRDDQRKPLMAKRILILE